jgi:hypothetical protein
VAAAPDAPPVGRSPSPLRQPWICAAAVEMRGARGEDPAGRGGEKSPWTLKEQGPPRTGARAASGPAGAAAVAAGSSDPHRRLRELGWGAEGRWGRGERWARERGRRGRGRGCGEASTRGVAAASEGRGRGDDSAGLGVGVLGFAFRGVGRGKLGRHVGFGQR